MNLQHNRRQELLLALKQSEQSKEVQFIKELVNNLLADAKDRLVTCTLTDLQKVQGEAQGYRRILALMDRPTVADIMKETANG